MEDLFGEERTNDLGRIVHHGDVRYGRSAGRSYCALVAFVPGGPSFAITPLPSADAVIADSLPERITSLKDFNRAQIAERINPDESRSFFESRPSAKQSRRDRGRNGA